VAVPRLKAMGTASRGRRGPKVLGGRRSGRLGEPPECVGGPCRHLGLGGPASPAAPLLPGGSLRRSLWVNIKDLWYKVPTGWARTGAPDDCPLEGRRN
jgi:hypothetical protein